MGNYIKPEIKIVMFDEEEILINSSVVDGTIDDWHADNPTAKIQTYKRSDFTEKVKITF